MTCMFKIYIYSSFDVILDSLVYLLIIKIKTRCNKRGFDGVKASVTRQCNI